ncbi:UNVERIFIED_CONTAM: putative inactive receptor kinase [Sesamum radiatum]|uniref:non-specific serine/threonine protein kinase n=1 Tax=Sesamum radiatum TaxID=300843 RepID=A0AAW2KCR7_SESRA
MSAIYDNWERLVAAVLKKQQLWELFHDHSRSPSILSEASDLSSSFSLTSPLHDLALEFSSPEIFLRSTKVTRRLALVSDFSSAFDFEDVFLASSVLLGRGTFGSTYTVALENGVQIVVKRLRSMNVSEQEFKSQMEIVGNVRHENVAALRAYYSSEEERLMLYDYYSDGSVHALLHEQTGQNQSPVDWETRWRIALGAARGIAAIHAQNGGKLVHGNIKASNIFLNSQNYGCVLDLGLATMVETKFMLTARKSPVHVPGGPKAVDLVKLVTSAKSKEKVAKVFDTELLKYPTISEQAVIMLQIGLTCVAKSIKKRPKMSEVVRMLEDINKMNRGITMNPQVSLERKLVFFEYANPRFEFEDLLSASAEFLGKGTFGTSYKAGLENGNTVVVKRLKDVIVTFEDFQQHMKVIGKLRHENVAELKAYYSTDEKLLVCDYYNQRSLSDLLHGKTDINRTFLDWETRLKIAIGVARGLAHIHRQDGEKVVHGNVKSSNIFLNGQRYGIVSDAGLAKLMNAISSSVIVTQGYHAPEVWDIRRVSQASDVYCFGIMLLELVTRRRTTTDDGNGSTLVKWIQDFVSYEWSTDVIDEGLLNKNLYAVEEMMRVLQLGMECAVTVPEHRPRMPQVVRMLEEICGIEPPGESGLDDIWEQPSLRQDWKVYWRICCPD